jgi:hypothetical protein
VVWVQENGENGESTATPIWSQQKPNPQTDSKKIILKILRYSDLGLDSAIIELRVLQFLLAIELRVFIG